METDQNGEVGAFIYKTKLIIGLLLVNIEKTLFYLYHLKNLK